MMTYELADQLAHFAGVNTCTRCFLHVVNLVAKTLIRIFDLPKKKDIRTSEHEDNEEEDWRELGQEHELEELQTRLEAYESKFQASEEMDGDLVEDDMANWVNKADYLTMEDCADLDAHMQVLCLMLVKVSGIH